MAFTVSKKTTEMGNLKVCILSCVADAATQVIQTGFEYVQGVNFCPISMTTCLSYHVWPNKSANTSATFATSNGRIAVSGFTTGDVFYLIAYGR